MDRKQNARYESFDRIRNFGINHRDLFPETSAAGLKFNALSTVVDLIETELVHSAEARAQAQKVKSETRRAVVTYMRALTSTGREASANDPGGHPFRMPRSQGGTALLTTARHLMAEVLRRKDRFAEFGMPDGFLAEFQKAVGDLEHAIEVRQNSRASRRKATAAVRAAIDRGNTLARQLDVIVTNVVRPDAVLLEEWLGARNVDDVPSAAATTVAATPVAGTPVAGPAAGATAVAATPVAGTPVAPAATPVAATQVASQQKPEPGSLAASVLKTAVALFLCLTSMSGVAAAQTDRERVALQIAADEGETLAFESNGTIFLGVARAVNSDTIEIAGNPRTQGLRFADIDRIYKRGDSIASGAAIGAAILGAWCAYICGQGLNSRDEYVPTLLNAAVVGGLIGAGIDWSHTGTTTLYRKRTRVRLAPSLSPRVVGVVARIIWR